MNKTILVALVMAMAIGTVSAQNTETDPRAGLSKKEQRKEEKREERKDPTRFREKYFNINYGFQHYNSNSTLDGIKSKAGFGFTAGQSFIIGDNLFFDMLRIGLDATWCDFHYARSKYNGHASQIDLGMGIGPSININPVGKLGIHAYAHYNPTLTALAGVKSDGSGGAAAGYTSFVVSGVAISWSVVQLGFEGRWGWGKYNGVTANGNNGGSIGDKAKIDTRGGRIYVGFRW